jgi:putative endonuclease
MILHNNGKVPATSFRRPLALIYYEAYLDKRDAYSREKWLKTGWGRNYFKKTLRYTLGK